MWLNEIFNVIHVDKYLSDAFPFQIALKYRTPCHLCQWDETANRPIVYLSDDMYEYGAQVEW
jgi:hypothetical protein